MAKCIFKGLKVLPIKEVLPMPVLTEIVLAMRCPECGKMDYHKVGRFSIARGEPLNIKCACGAEIFNVTTQDRSQYRIRLTCVYCGGRHNHIFSGKKIWCAEDTIDFYCSETGLELGCIGPEAMVRKIIKGREKELESLVDEFGRDAFFHNSSIMHDVLLCLQDISEKGNLYCECGNYQIGVDIFPDRLELCCNKCDSVNIIYAENEEDLQVIQGLEEIELIRNGFECLDSLSRTTNSNKAPDRGSKKNKTKKNH